MTLVFYIHFHALFAQYLSLEGISWRLSRLLQMVSCNGTYLFLCISGYLIYGQLMQRRVSYSAFLRRRVQRIYPVFLCVLAIYLILFAAFPAKSKLPDSPAAAALCVLQNALLVEGVFGAPRIITVSWTLTLLFAFYLSLPVSVEWSRMRHRSAGTRALWILLCGGAITLVCLLVKPGALPGRVAMFIVGMLAYESLQHGVGKRLRPAGEALAVALFMISGIVSQAPVTDAARFFPFVTVLLAAVSLYLFCLYSFGGNGVLRRLFSVTPLRWLGAISLSYYLLHGVTLHGVLLMVSLLVPPTQDRAWVFWAALPACYLATLASAAVLFAAVERRFSASPAARRDLTPTQEEHEAAAVFASDEPPQARVLVPRRPHESA
jgi:peptidoglycan/LPS O-acetylase OafA/YrhL